MSGTVKYLVLESHGSDRLCLQLTSDELYYKGVDVSKLPTDNFMIIDTGELQPIRDKQQGYIPANLEDLKREIPI